MLAATPTRFLSRRGWLAERWRSPAAREHLRVKYDNNVYLTTLVARLAGRLTLVDLTVRLRLVLG